MKVIAAGLRGFFILIFVFLAAAVSASEIERFAGSYSGSAEFLANGETQRRDLSVKIEENREGFTLSWTSVSYKSDGRTKESAYTIEFVPSPRSGIYGSAMKVNVFGKRKPLDPLNGEPFVWTRIIGDTFSTFSLFITDSGEYEMQEYHRTLVDGGLQLKFLRLRDGAIVREIDAFLEKID